MARDLKFNLLENAIDSLQRGIGFALKDKPSQSDLKLSVLLIVQSIELLLKERLKRQDKSLVFSKVEQSGNPNAHTVTIEEAIKRLEKVAGVKLDEEEIDVILLFSRIRNHIQHYEIEITFEEVLGKAHAAISFITRFLKDELKEDIREYLEQGDVQKLLYVDEALAHLIEMAKENIEALRKENKPSSYKDQVYWRFEIIECPECLQDYYVFSPDSDISQCQLCGYEGDFIECARCGYQTPQGALGFDNCDVGTVLCDNCWDEIGNETFELPD